jgi:hypothetical protein
MSIPRRRTPATSMAHPLVREQRMQDGLRLALTAAVPAVTATAVTIALPNTSILVVLAVLAALLSIIVLMVSSRLDLTVAFLAIYLGMLDGPVKLLLNGRELTASFQDVIILAVSAGALMRVLMRKEPVRLPPLSGWLIAWVVLVLVNAFNPRTEGVLHALGGFRQQLEFVPFFFFGYVLMRSKRRFRQLFVILGVMAFANGIVAAYQTELSPGQLAAWGPGYQALIHPPGVGTGRVYFSEGEARVRPPGLGSEAGYSGAVGHIALPMCLALLVISRRRKWIAVLLCLGAIIGVFVGLGRLPLIGAGLGVITFIAYAALSGRSLTRSLVALFAITLLVIPAGVLVVSALRPGTFKRYEQLSTGSETTLHKENAWSKIPLYAEVSPFGFGLGNSGAVAGVGGRESNLLNGHGLTSETEYNVLIKELGVPGLLLWPAIVIYVSILTAIGLKRITDSDLAICLAGTMAPFAPLLLEGSSGFISASTADGAYFWFAVGVAAYWFVRPKAAVSRPELERPKSAPLAIA